MTHVMVVTSFSRALLFPAHSSRPVVQAITSNIVERYSWATFYTHSFHSITYVGLHYPRSAVYQLVGKIKLSN